MLSKPLIKTVIILLFAFFGTSSFAFDAKELFKNSINSVVLIVSFDEFKKPLAYGSGFFVDDGTKIATNYHVISGADYLAIKTISGDLARIDSIYGYDLDHDLALLKSPVKGTPLTLAKNVPETGEDIIAIGNPKGLEGTLSKGIVSGIRETGGALYYQITAPISPGNSGGPVINSKGEALGVSTFYLIGGQNLNFAIPTAYIHKLIRHKAEINLATLKNNPKAEIFKREEVKKEGVKVIESKIPRYGQKVTASILNNNSYTIKNTRILAIFYSTKTNNPVHFITFKIRDEIPSKLAKRFSKRNLLIEGSWVTKFRVLDYEIVDQNDSIAIPVFE